MKKTFILLATLLTLAGPVRAERHGFLHTVLLYLPNRVFDVFDLARARLRVGPGFAVDVRATELADAYLGGYTSLYIGLPGPRGKPTIPWPAGVETRAGAEVSVLDATAAAGPSDPGYGIGEIGAGAHIGLVGLDVGFDVFEVLDFVLGFLTIDLSEDDL